MRIVIYSSVDPEHRGGVQAVCRRLTAFLRHRGHSVVQAWSQPDPAAASGDARFELPLVECGASRSGARSVARALRALWRLARQLRHLRPDVVNIHFVTYDAAYFLLLRVVLRYRLVLSVHGSDVLRPKPWNAWIVPRLLRRADGVTVVSRLTGERVTGAGVQPEALRLIRNGVDLEFWSDVRAADPAEREAIVLSVGRLHPVKGHDLLLRAFASVHSRVPRARLLIAGEGGFRRELERLALDLGIGDAVALPGQLEPAVVRELMGRARVFVLPSRSEGLPLAPMEAMAARVPVVAAAVGGVQEVLTPATAVLVPPENSEALAAAIVELLTDDASSRELIGRGASACVRFSAADSDAAYEEFLIRIAQR